MLNLTTQLDMLYVSHYIYVTGPAKIDHVSAKKSLIFSMFAVLTIYTTGTKSSSLLQISVGILLQLTEMG